LTHELEELQDKLSETEKLKKTQQVIKIFASLLLDYSYRLVLAALSSTYEEQYLMRFRIFLSVGARSLDGKQR
jgi:hypothetical protein